MNDRFLNEHRREPRPEFAGALHQRLRAQGEAGEIAAERRRPLRLALVAACAVIAIGAAFMLPAVRASAQAFLDLFRVRNFTAVTVSETRLKQLRDGKVDLQSVLGGPVEKVKDGGAPRPLHSVGEAMPVLGYLPKTPTRLPAGLAADTVWVHDASEANVTLDTHKLRDVLETLDIRDVIVPDQLNGQRVTVRVAPVVTQEFHGGDRRAALIQSRSPEVALPPGADLAQLGEIGLRIIGLDANQARSLARSIDWRSTAVVPVPANVGAFREVDVNGHRGLMVTCTAPDAKKGDGGRRAGTVILWSEDDMVFALSSDVGNVDLLDMANSIR